LIKIVKGRIPTAKFKIVLRHIFLGFPDAVSASANGGFRIVVDTLVLSMTNDQS